MSRLSFPNALKVESSSTVPPDLRPVSNKNADAEQEENSDSDSEHHESESEEENETNEAPQNGNRTDDGIIPSATEVTVGNRYDQ